MKKQFYQFLGPSLFVFSDDLFRKPFHILLYCIFHDCIICLCALPKGPQLGIKVSVFDN